jgi:hypothetical protein
MFGLRGNQRYVLLAWRPSRDTHSGHPSSRSISARGHLSAFAAALMERKESLVISTPLQQWALYVFPWPNQTERNP